MVRPARFSMPNAIPFDKGGNVSHVLFLTLLVRVVVHNATLTVSLHFKAHICNRSIVAHFTRHKTLRRRRESIIAGPSPPTTPAVPGSWSALLSKRARCVGGGMRYMRCWHMCNECKGSLTRRSRSSHVDARWSRHWSCYLLRERAPQSTECERLDLSEGQL